MAGNGDQIKFYATAFQMKLDLSITANASSVIDSDSGLAIFVDSFDNQEFAVRIGSLQVSTLRGTITATSDAELNASVMALVNAYQARRS